MSAKPQKPQTKNTVLYPAVISQPVVIDAADLFILCQAANAWAGALRKGVVGTKTAESVKTADAIDMAASHARRDSLGTEKMPEIFNG